MDQLVDPTRNGVVIDNRYELQHTLGKGKFAVVKLARIGIFIYIYFINIWNNFNLYAIQSFIQRSFGLKISFIFEIC